MDKKESRRLTRRKASEDRNKKNDTKRRRMLMFQPRKLIGPRDIPVNMATCKIKTEEDPRMHAKKEPESYAGSVDDLQGQDVHVVKEEVDIPMDSKEALNAEGGVVRDGANLNECCCSQEIKILKEVIQQKDEQLEKELKARDLKIQGLNERMDKLEQLLAKKFDCQQDTCVEQRCTFSHQDHSSLEQLAKSDTVEHRIRNDACEQNVAGQATHDIQDSVSSYEATDNRVVDVFGNVIGVFWDKYAASMKNSRDYLNLNCRLVCTSWKMGMDSILTGTKSPINVNTTFSFKMKSYREIADLVNPLLGQPKNSPFPPRHLTILDSRLRPSSTASKKCGLVVEAFIKKFGSTMESFEYRILNESNGSLNDWYCVLLTWLGMMPNLKDLTIHDHPNANSRIENSFRDVIRKNPFPKFKQLTRLNLTSSGSQHFMLSAMTANKQVQEMKLNYLPRNAFKYVAPPNLVHLDIRLNSDTDLQALCSLKAPLKVLKILCCTKYLKLDDSALLQILNFVERFATIKSFSMNALPNLASCRPISLPNLEAFTIKLANVTGSGQLSTDEDIIRMVSEFPSLQNLTIYNLPVLMLSWNYPSKAKRCQLRKLLESNFVDKLWNTLPTLKQVEISSYYGYAFYTFLFIRKNN